MLQETWGRIYPFEILLLFPLGTQPEMELLGCMVGQFLILLWKLQTIVSGGWRRSFPPTVHLGSVFYHVPSAPVVSCLPVFLVFLIAVLTGVSSDTSLGF